MRVGIYFGTYKPAAGGAYTHSAEVLAAVARLAPDSPHQYVLLGEPAAVRPLEEAVSGTGIAVAAVPRTTWVRGRLRQLRYASALFRLLWRRPPPIERVARKQGLDVVWFVDNKGYDLPGVPYIATVFDLQHRVQPYFPEVSGGGEWDGREEFYGQVLRRAAYCLTGTEAGKREIQHLYQVPGERIRVVPFPTPGFALEGGGEAVDPRDRFGLTRDYVVYPAQFWPHKNHANLILALSWLERNEGLALDLVLVGSDKGNLPHVRALVEREGLADRVHFPGFVSVDELISLYRHAAALTFVSYFGPDNIPPLEAFALGCPAVVARVDGASDQYGDAALQVDPSDPAEIGRAIARVHRDRSLRSRLVDAGLVRARSWPASSYVSAVHELLDEFARVRRNWPEGA